MLFGHGQLARVAVFEHAAFDQEFCGFGNGLDDSRIAVPGQHKDRPRNEKVAHENAGVASPLGVNRFVAAPDRRFVNHVVVEQGCSVDVLDHARVADGALIDFTPTQPNTEHEEKWTDAFPAVFHQVIADAGDKRDVRLVILSDCTLHP